MACRYFVGDKELSREELTSFVKNLSHEEKLNLAPEIARDSYQRLSWTPGEAQAARYDLSKDVSKVYLNNPVWHGENDIRGNLIVTGKNGNDLISKPVKSLSEIKDLIGKEAADNLVSNPSSMQGRDHVLSGDGLKVGGEGMKGFYDQIIPKALEKLGKEHGVKVKRGGVNVPSKSALDNWPKPTSKAEKVHYIDIPQSLKDQAMHKGFPLFSAGGHMLIPVDHNPFEPSKEKEKIRTINPGKTWGGKDKNNMEPLDVQTERTYGPTFKQEDL